MIFLRFLQRLGHSCCAVATHVPKQDMEKLNLTPDVEATIINAFHVNVAQSPLQFSASHNFDHPGVHISSQVHVVVQKELVPKNGRSNSCLQMYSLGVLDGSL